LCVLRCCDARLKSSALRVGVNTLHNTQCQLDVNTNSSTIYFQDASLDIQVHTTFMWIAIIWYNSS